MPLPRPLALCLFLGCSFVLSVRATPWPSQTGRPAEVREAYRVRAEFERLMREDLNFERAYEATFTRNPGRRRAVAIADGEFGELDFNKIGDDALVRAYKLRMQIFYLMLLLSGPENDEEERLFYPPEVKEMVERKAPREASEFKSYVSRLESDVRLFRSHVKKLAAAYPAFAERVNKFKREALSAPLAPRGNESVKSRRGAFKGVLGKNQPYYEIDGYTIAEEDGRMRIFGIKFFNRLI
jgi:hypothetical protein